MKYFKSLGLCLVAMFALGALMASAAQAETNEGPLWIVGSPAKQLVAGETRAIISKTEEEPVLHATASGVPNTICTKATNTGFLLGGSPGTDFTTITFVGCRAEGKTNCVATGTAGTPNPGEIIVTALTVLAYAKGSRTSALDLLAPEESSNLFVEYELKGTECGGILNKAKVKVLAKGSEVEIKNEKRKLGQASQVGYLKEGSFFLSLSGETAEIGLLVLPSTPITEASLYNTTTAKYETVMVKLEAGALGEAWEIAKAEIETSPKAPFGWDT
jgi:hypothetical protein